MEQNPQAPSAKTIQLGLETAAQALTESEAAATELLKIYVAQEPAEHQIFACFEIFSFQNYSLNYNGFFVREKDGKKLLDTEWNTLLDGESFIPKLAEAMTAFFEKHELSQTTGESLTEQLDAQLLAWFKKCWVAAGGEHAKIPTYVALDKEYQCRNILTGEVLEELDTAKSLGYDVSDVFF